MTKMFHRKNHIFPFLTQLIFFQKTVKNKLLQPRQLKLM
jgi:hypothetical protein